MDRRTVTLYEDIKHQVDLAEQIHNDLSDEILELTKQLGKYKLKCESLENQLRLMRSGKE